MTSILNTHLTIKEAAAYTGLSAYTLRYYERIGLLMPVGRAHNGHRRYSPEDMDRIKLLNRMRLTGMPLDQIRRYAALLTQGDASIPERQAILEAHRREVLRQVAELQETLAVIDYKLGIYQQIEPSKP